MKRKMILAATASLVLLSAGTVTAFAADGGYSYLEGQKRSEGRLAVYSEAEKFTTDSERDEFLQSQGIGDTEYSEENAASYSYIDGQKRGASHKTEDSANSSGQTESYQYAAGQKRGSSYCR